MAWIFITLILPLILPVVGMWLVGRVPAFQNTAELLVPIKDGQLCWGALAMLMSAYYEMLNPPQGVSFSPTYTTWMSILLCLVTFGSAVIAALGAVSPTPMPRPPATPWHKHYTVMTTSIALTLTSALCYGLIHFEK